ncbi:interleukin-27 subunit beta [Cricetulus griseus]|uniref:Interleukin-27 subunit beta n=1 Tax=Cricetulus griseus TaxID=10029 RepID=G3HCF0_CRIGR|nr:interleukin-27 subunit beta [Cricetulus griseus]EGV93687.1 Interleukin-27 subunit beta [Cricetulus griseus]
MCQRLLLSLALWASCSPGNTGTALAALSQPRVRCRASRYPVAVDCSWTPLRAPNSTRAMSFIATYRLGMDAQQQSLPCLLPTPQATQCTVPDVHLFSTVPYVLNVTAVHPGGASSSLLAFVAERIIKPDPPESVRLRAAGQQLQVLWHPPASWPFPDIFSLKYRVRYRRHGASHFRQVGPIEATTFTLRTTKPHAKYCIQVSAQDLTDYGKPSDWSLPGQAERTPQKP